MFLKVLELEFKRLGKKIFVGGWEWRNSSEMFQIPKLTMG